MTKTPMPLKTHREVGPADVLPTDVPVINVRSIGVARNFVTFMEGASGHLIALDMNLEGKTAGHVMLQVS